MKFSEHELKKLFDGKLNITTEELCHQLTMLGLEVEECESVAPGFSGVMVGEIVDAVQHPNADRLRVCQVNVGKDLVLNIVCGAPNARKGIKVAVSTIGACLPHDFKIKETQLRGVTSQGMLCSEKELGLPESIDGIIELPIDAPIGQDIREYLDLDDHCITINLTPNRGDCLSLYGIAREIAVLNHLPAPSLSRKLPVKTGTKGASVKATKACPHYLLAVVDGVNNQLQTPREIKQRLERSGIRSISPIVDILNDVMILTGQPMHAFDADKVQGEIVVDFAKAGESISLLNDETIKLRADTLTIRDDKGAMAIAGIMGDTPSSVDLMTKNILIEAAFFEPIAIAGKARSYGLHTDSSHRFERGVDPELAEKALALALQKIKDTVGGHLVGIVEKSVLDSRPRLRGEGPFRGDDIVLHDAKTTRLLGVPIKRDFALKTLQALGCKIIEEQVEFIKVVPPSFRFDLNIEEDLIEELARIAGYDHLPLQLPKFDLMTHFALEAETPLCRLKSLLTSNGLSEVVTYSFIDEDLQNAFFDDAQYKLDNPITKELTSMRKSLVPSLLNVLKYNLSRQQTEIAIFEVGERFVGLPPIQHETLGGLLYGKALDFYDLKGVVQKIFKFARLNVQFKKQNLPGYIHPGQGLEILLGKKPLGYFGALHPKLLSRFDLKEAPFVFEISTEAFLHGEPRVAGPISKFPMIERDLAFLLERSTPAGTLLEAAKSLKSPILQEVFVFDVYAGDRLPPNQKSIAIKLRMQALERTLVDEEVDSLIGQIVEKISKDCGAVLREA